MKSYGQIAYEAYCEHTQWKSLISGAQLPEWERLDKRIQATWCVAANAVVEEYQILHGP